MKRVFYSFIYVLTSAVMAVPQEAADPFFLEKRLPPETFFYLSVPHDPARGADFARSHLRKFMNHSEIRGFVEPIEKYLYKRLREDRFIRGVTEPSWNKVVRDEIGLSVDELAALAIGGPLSIAVIDIPINPEHTIDIVLRIGGSTEKLEQAATRIKKKLTDRDLDLVESQYEYKKHTIHELGAEHFSIYHTILEKSVVVTTSQPRMESIIDGPESNLAGFKPFATVRKQVSPDDKHLLFGYVGVEAIFRMFRKEIGDEALKTFERLGLRDVTAIAGAIGYDLPYLRERYAIATSRQDRGIVKMLAGKAGKDPAASFVPASAVEYGHFSVPLAPLLDLAEFVPDLAESIQDYESRIGVDIRKDLLARVGPAWTSYAMFPEAGGAWPDALWITELREKDKFFAALDKIAADAGWRTDSMTFEGETIRLIQIDFDGWFSTPLATMEKDGRLFASTNPLAIKRQILRFTKRVAPKTFNRRFTAFAEGADAFEFVDLGKLFTFGYNTVEPFLHYLRDFARDPDTGEYIIDLAKLPLGEVVGDLMGATMSVKRTKPDFILIESLSNTGFSPTSATVYVASVAAMIIPMVMSGGEPPGVFGPAENERRAQLSLQAIRIAQAVFRNSDMDRNEKEDYWTTDVAGLYGLKDKNENTIFLIDLELAAADPAGAKTYGLTPAPKNGYWFKVVGGAKGWAVVAYPAALRVTGNNTFLIDDEGTIWKKDTSGKPVETWPKSPEKEGWRKAD